MVKLIKKCLFIAFALVLVLMSTGYGSKNVKAYTIPDNKPDTSGSISLSESSVSLDLNGTRSKSVTVSHSYSKKSIRYRYETSGNDGGYATLSWGDWNNDETECPLTLTGQKIGSFQLRVKLLDNVTDDMIATTDWITVTVLSTTSHIPNQDSFCTTCGGLGDCPECFGSGHQDCTGLHCLGGMCLECSGTGTIVNYYVGAGTKERTCTYCHGTGFCSRCSGNGFIDCPRCYGGSCPTCHGTGYK